MSCIQPILILLTKAKRLPMITITVHLCTATLGMHRYTVSPKDFSAAHLISDAKNSIDVAPIVTVHRYYWPNPPWLELIMDRIPLLQTLEYCYQHPLPCVRDPVDVETLAAFSYLTVERCAILLWPWHCVPRLSSWTAIPSSITLFITFFITFFTQLLHPVWHD